MFLLVAWWLHATIAATPGRDHALVVAATIATLATIALPSTGFPVPWALAVLCVPAVALVAFKIPRELP